MSGIIEYKLTNVPVQITRGEGGQEYISGYAVVFYDKTPATEYRESDMITERISRSAFDRVLASGKRVEARYNHSKDHYLASTDEGTLFLRKDKKGIAYQIPFDANMPDHVKVRALIDKGVLRGSSFAAVGRASLKRGDNGYIRTIEEIDEWIDVAPVNSPAYGNETAAIVRKEIDAWERTQERIRRILNR